MRHFGVKSFQKNVSLAATPEVLTATTLNTGHAIIRAKSTNTGPVYIGSDATVSASNGFSIAAGSTLTLPAISVNQAQRETDLSLIYVKVNANGEGVEVIYITSIDT